MGSCCDVIFGVPLLEEVADYFKAKAGPQRYSADSLDGTGYTSRYNAYGEDMLGFCGEVVFDFDEYNYYAHKWSDFVESVVVSNEARAKGLEAFSSLDEEVKLILAKFKITEPDLYMIWYND